MSIDNIVSTLEKLERLHRSLLDVCVKKTEVIKESDIEGLNNMLKSEQTHIAAIERLEQQRQVEVTDYLRAKGFAPTEAPTVAQLIEAAPMDQKEALQQMRTRLIAVIDELKKRNDLNQKMIFQSLQFVNITLDLVQPRPEQMNYSSDIGGQAPQQQKKSYFDSQA
ncbi:MAG: flagellar protein FlgN [Caryophanon sp.]|nr:flagellar protein FlgN [Caryophanon sp.]